MLEVVPVVVKSEGFDFMHDERLDRRLKRRNIGTRRFKKDGHDRDVGNEDCRKYYDGSFRGLFIDSDAHLDTNYEVDEHCKKVSKDLDGGLYVDSDCDAYSDKSSSKRNTRSTDNGDGAGTNEDPDYKMFLDKFRQDGKSCILEIPLTNEISITVRYHSQDGAYDGCDMEKPDIEKDCPERQNKGTTKLLKIDSTIERMETMSDTRKERVVASRKLRGCYSKSNRDFRS
ncbi:hypothetical protein OIU76_021974 [Salix suchowensis]|nr:hypothetical protein OIU76_021974 [Salix suchowensis]